MKKSRFFSALLIVSLLFVVLPATTRADMWDVPVAPGESFRWVFVTSTGRDATSNDISVYNGFVNQVADDAVTPVTGVVGVDYLGDIEWRAIASTETTNAIDNIGGFSTAGIYTPMGALVANGTTDMFDREIESPINVTETGATYEYAVWTGTEWDGEAGPTHFALGEAGGSNAGLSSEESTFVLWIDGPFWPQDADLPLYAISEELTVVPVPGAVLLGMLGMGVAGLKLRKHA